MVSFPLLQPDDMAALLTAERAVGRFAQLADDPALAAALAADALRTEVLATLILDRLAVDWQDLAIGLIAVDLVPAGKRREVANAVALHDILEAAQQGRLRPPAPKRGEPVPDLIRSARTLLADTRALLIEFADNEEEVETDDGAEPPAAALTSPWLARLWTAAGGGDDLAEATNLAVRLDDILRAPGLIGAAGALHHLHTVGERTAVPPMRRVASTGRFARCAAPFLLRHCCALEPALWLSATLLAERPAYERASGPSWYFHIITRAVDAQVKRGLVLRRTLDLWRDRLDGHRSTSRTGEVLALLLRRPAITTRMIVNTLGTTHRGAQIIADALCHAGILREITRRRVDRIYLADALR